MSSDGALKNSELHHLVVVRGPEMAEAASIVSALCDAYGVPCTVLGSRGHTDFFRLVTARVLLLTNGRLALPPPFNRPAPGRLLASLDVTGIDALDRWWPKGVRWISSSDVLGLLSYIEALRPPSAQSDIDRVAVRDLLMRWDEEIARVRARSSRHRPASPLPDRDYPSSSRPSRAEPHDGWETLPPAGPRPDSERQYSRAPRQATNPPARRRSGRSPISAVQVDRRLRRAVDVVLAPGGLLVNVPSLRQGRTDRVSVGIARDTAALAALAAKLDVAEDSATPLDTSPFMEVSLKGRAFTVTRVAPPDSGQQLVLPAATWIFDTLPLRAGLQLLTVTVDFLVPIPGHPDVRTSVPAWEQDVLVEVDRVYAAKTFASANWPWLTAVATLVLGILTLALTLH